LWAWREAGPRRGAVYGGVAGAVFFGVLVSWTRYFGFIAYIPFVIVLSAWWAVAGAAVGWLERRGRGGTPVVAAVWVLAEAGRGHLPLGGFSWGEVGYAFHDVAVARSLAAWGGHLLVSFAAVIAGGLVVDGVVAARECRLRGAGRAAAGMVAVLAVAGAAHLLLPELPATGRLRVALVQGNDRNRDLTPAEVGERYLPRNHLRLAAGIHDPVDLIVFPESSLDADPRGDAGLDDALAATARAHAAGLLAGGNTDAPGGRLYNTAFYYRPDGRWPQLYRKQHLVPFGEYVPWRSELSFISALRAVPHDFAPGRSGTRFPVAGRTVGTLICFDSAFSELSRRYARHGAEALIVMTNNRSYRRSANSAQHLAIGQLRAAETGRPLLQAAISGISGIVDRSGRLQAETALFSPTVLEGEVTTTSGRTPYVALGPWVLLVAAAVMAAAVAGGVRRPGPSLNSRPWR
jgi:apolipoprotein N-acyltransferase